MVGPLTWRCRAIKSEPIEPFDWLTASTDRAFAAERRRRRAGAPAYRGVASEMPRRRREPRRGSRTPVRVHAVAAVAGAMINLGVWRQAAACSSGLVTASPSRKRTPAISRGRLAGRATRVVVGDAPAEEHAADAVGLTKPLADEALEFAPQPSAIFLLRWRDTHRGADPRLAKVVGQERPDQGLAVDPIGLRSPSTPRRRDRNGVDDMALDAFALERAISLASWPRAPISRAQSCAVAHASLATTQRGCDRKKPRICDRSSLRRNTTEPSVAVPCA